MSTPADDIDVFGLGPDQPGVARRGLLGSVPFVLDDETHDRLAALTGGSSFLVTATLLGAAAAVVGAGGPCRAVLGAARPATSRNPSVRVAVEVSPLLSFRDLLVQARAALQDADRDELHSAYDPNDEPSRLGVRVAELHGPAVPAADPELDVLLDVTVDQAGRPTGCVRYDPARLDASTAERFACATARALRNGLPDPGRVLQALDLLAASERADVVERGRGPRAADGGRTVHGLFEAVAAAHPTAVALDTGSATMTYRELDQRSSSVARALAGVGVGVEDRVGVMVPGGTSLVVAMLGTLKAGAAWVPFDPEEPETRRDLIAADAGLAAILTSSSWPSSVPRHGPVLDVDAASGDGDGGAAPVCVGGDNLAYVVHTSGSTGRPKGVLVTHAALANILSASIELLGVGPGTPVLQFATPTFDASIWQLWIALAAGATAHLIGPEERRDLAAVQERIRLGRVEVADLPPALLTMLDPDDVPSLRVVTTGGDRTPGPTVERWRRRCFHNVYGPTEATIATTHHRVDADDDAGHVPIGRPFAGAACHVLDGRLEPVPSNVVGELHLGGAGIARGYLGRPDLTAAAFVPDPFSATPGARLYRTGDLAYRGANGELHFVGRRDGQVKVRGFRIELGEVERVLEGHEHVRDAAVVVRGTVGEAGDGRRLVGYVSGHGETVDVAAVHAFVQARLPNYMVPAAIVVVPELPRLPNLKVDRSRLPEPAEHADDPPRPGAETIVADIFALVLDWPSVGRDANFFLLGGHSLLATRIMSRVCDAFGVDLPLRTIFDSPTPALLAAVATAALASGVDPDFLNDALDAIEGLTDDDVVRLLESEAR